MTRCTEYQSYEDTVCTEDQSRDDKVYVQSTSPLGTQCMCSGPALWGHRGPFLWRHSVCAGDLPYGNTEDHSFGDTVNVQAYGDTMYTQATSPSVCTKDKSHGSTVNKGPVGGGTVYAHIISTVGATVYLQRASHTKTH